MLVAENTSLVSCKDHHTCPLQAVVPLTGRTSRSSCRLVAPVPSRLQRTCQCPQSGTHARRLEWDVAALGLQVAPQFPRVFTTHISQSVSFVAVPQRSPHRLKGGLRSPRSTHSVNTSTEYALARVLNFASEVGLSRNISFDRSLVSLHSSKRSSALCKL